jgi:hypothetical protein
MRGEGIKILVMGCKRYIAADDGWKETCLRGCSCLVSLDRQICRTRDIHEAKKQRKRNRCVMPQATIAPEHNIPGAHETTRLCVKLECGMKKM